jgi:hypothetical protein
MNLLIGSYSLVYFLGFGTALGGLQGGYNWGVATFAGLGGNFTGFSGRIAGFAGNLAPVYANLSPDRK